MIIQKITDEHRNDFSAILECEHCGATSLLTSGYHDNRYHTKVIPAFMCEKCSKRRDGQMPTDENQNGFVPLAAPMTPVY